MELVGTQPRNKIHPHKFVLWVSIASIVMMFAGLTSAFVVKSNLPGWKEIAMPGIFWYSTAAMVLSSVTIAAALRSFKQREMRSYRILIALTFILGLTFLALQGFGFRDLWGQQIKFRGSAGAGQFLYVIFGLHALHVLAGVIALMVLLLKAFFGKIKIYSSVPVEVAATYWHFVDLLWIYLFIFFMVIM